MVLVLELSCLCGVPFVKINWLNASWMFKVELKHEATTLYRGHVHIFKGQDTLDRKPGVELGRAGLRKARARFPKHLSRSLIRKSWARTTEGVKQDPKNQVMVFMFSLVFRELIQKVLSKKCSSKNRSWPIDGSRNKLCEYPLTFFLNKIENVVHALGVSMCVPLLSGGNSPSYIPYPTFVRVWSF